MEKSKAEVTVQHINANTVEASKAYNVLKTDIKQANLNLYNRYSNIMDIYFKDINRVILLHNVKQA